MITLTTIAIILYLISFYKVIIKKEGNDFWIPIFWVGCIVLIYLLMYIVIPFILNHLP